MRILLEAHHPAHIHLFKNAVRSWQERGHEVLMLGRDRDVMKALLRAYDWIPSVILSQDQRNNRFPLAEFLQRQAGVASHILRFRPDVVASTMGSYTQSSKLLDVPSVIFTDSEHQAFNHRIAHPFAKVIYTPRCFYKDLGPKQHRYAGYHELAFVHPKYFTPRREVLEKLGGIKPHSYTLLRTSAFNTLHDIGQAGLGAVMDEVIRRCEERGPVFIVAEENKIPSQWRDKHLSLPPDWFHDVIAFAGAVVTEGASTASEAACLGIPTVYVNSHAVGYLLDQQRAYDLVDVLSPDGPIVACVEKRLAQANDRARWDAAKEALLRDHDDVTEVIAEAVERAAL